MSNIFPSATTHRHSFTPSFLEDAKPKPVFWFRAASFAERAQYFADLDMEAGREVHQFQLDAAFLEGLEVLLADREDQPENADQRAQIVDILNADRSGQVVSADDIALLNRVWEAVSTNWRDLAELMRRRNLRNQIVHGYAMLHFCVGLDNVVSRNGDILTFETDGTGKMKENIILAMDSFDVAAAGTFANNLQFGGSAEKNSSPPSRSVKKPKRSTEATQAPG